MYEFHFQGLAISKSEETFREAKVRRLKKTAMEVAVIEEVLLSLQSKKSWFKYLSPSYWIKNSRKSAMLFQHLKMLHDVSSPTLTLLKPSPWKICVLPHSFEHLRNNPGGTKFLDPKSNNDDNSMSMDNDYNVYIYNDLEGKYASKLNMTIPAWIVGKTLAILLERKIQANDQSAEEIENDMKATDTEGSFLARFNQSLAFDNNGEKQLEKRRDSHTIESMKESFKMSAAVFLISGLRRWKKRASETINNEKRATETIMKIENH